MENDSLADLEENAYRTVVDDGVLDICVGLFVLIFGLILATDIHLVGSLDLPVIFILFLWPLWRFLRRTFVEPRVGMVRLHPSRVAKVKRNKKVVIFIWVAISVGVWALFEWGMSGSDPPGWLEQLHDMKRVVGGVMLAFPFALSALLFDLKRWWIHAALIVAGGVGDYVANVPDGGGTWWFASGTVITAFGVVLLIRFVREHSIHTSTEEAQ